MKVCYIIIQFWYLCMMIISANFSPIYTCTMYTRELGWMWLLMQYLWLYTITRTNNMRSIIYTCGIVRFATRPTSILCCQAIYNKGVLVYRCLVIIFHTGHCFYWHLRYSSIVSTLRHSWIHYTCMCPIPVDILFCTHFELLRQNFNVLNCFVWNKL